MVAMVGSIRNEVTFLSNTRRVFTFRFLSTTSFKAQGPSGPVPRVQKKQKKISETGDCRSPFAECWAELTLWDGWLKVFPAVPSSPLLLSSLE